MCIKYTTASALMERGWELVIVTSPLTLAIPDDTPEIDDADYEASNPDDDLKNDIKILEFALGSDVPFVDDGREPHRGVQRSPAPWLVSSHIDDQLERYPVDSLGTMRVPADSHEIYSIQEGVGFYPEDWLPTYVLDGYKLLFVDNQHYPDTGNAYLKIYFVPNDFVVTEHTTMAWGYDSWNGYKISVERTTAQMGEVVDREEHFKEFFEGQSGYEGRFLDWTRDGEPMIAHGAQSDSNHYRAIVGYYPDSHTSVVVISSYHTLEELRPVLDSLGP